MRGEVFLQHSGKAEVVDKPSKQTVHEQNVETRTRIWAGWLETVNPNTFHSSMGQKSKSMKFLFNEH